ncbi:MAG: NAD-dependent epimerase/dehydratase [Solirubrobacterales bacterium]|nr:NAD-dependent epimerase/dehydratase [Solirubrobacterales bacterium]
MRTAVVTGGAGFIGSHVAERLIADGYRVIVVDDLSTGSEQRVPAEADFERLDIVEYERLRDLIISSSPEAIFHLGAQSMVTVSVSDPWRDSAVNVTGTLNVLQAGRGEQVPIVFTSTGGALYGNEAPLPTPETQLPAPVAPYGASKWAAEAYVQTWALADAVPHSVCRLGNVYGPRQSPHGEAGVVSIISHKLWSGEPPTLFGNGEATRDYLHVTDAVEAMVRAAGAGGVFNISAGREVPVREIFDLLSQESGVQVEPVLAPLREGELERSRMDPTRAAERLGWKAEISLERGVPETYRALVKEFETGD